MLNYIYLSFIKNVLVLSIVFVKKYKKIKYLINYSIRGSTIYIYRN